MSETRVLPEGQFDGQVFIDFTRIKWVYDESIHCWKRDGKVDSIPKADSNTSGLLSKELKYLLDKVPEKGGGYGIITKPKLQFRSQDNPDGVLFGDIELISDSLDIKCVHGDGTEIGSECAKVCYSETDPFPPGFDINLSDLFLRTFCVEISGGSGPVGARGATGNKGKDGTGDGPKGLIGNNGSDYTAVHKLSGVKTVDLDNITDMAVVKMELDQESGKLFVTKGKVKVSDDVDVAARQLITSQINRVLSWTDDFWGYELKRLPCGPDDDFDVLDPPIAYYPIQFDPENIDPELVYQPVKRRLSDLIDDLIALYKQKFNEAAEKYDLTVGSYIAENDKNARQVLDTLGDRLADCEFIQYLEYCIGIKDGKCIESGGSGSGGTFIELSADNPDCAAVATAAGIPGAACIILSNLRVLGSWAPIFSFEKPDNFSWDTRPPQPPNVQVEQYCPNGCWVRDGSGVWYLRPGGSLMAGWTPIHDPNDPLCPPNCSLPVVATREVGSQSNFPNVGGGGGVIIGWEPPFVPGEFLRPDQRQLEPDAPDAARAIEVPRAAADEDYQNRLMVSDLQRRLYNGVVNYKKQQFIYSDLTSEFPAGNYAFVYVGGAFKQDRKTVTHDTAYFEKGAYTDYWVGNENGRDCPECSPYAQPVYVRNIENLREKYPFMSELKSSEHGLEIGFAPNDYVDPVPDDYFDTHKYDPANDAELGLPKNHVDYFGTITKGSVEGNQRYIMESKIIWKKFPVMSKGNPIDATSVEQAYNSGPVSGRIMVFNTTKPGFFYARVKCAYSAISDSGKLVMPPVEFNASMAVPSSLQLADVRLKNPRSGSVVADANSYPVVDARPVASGQVTIQVIKIASAQATQATVATALDSPLMAGFGLALGPSVI
ncbi:MAG TPA: hypothetical protein VMW42_07260 [Desulfatiglandales bacterium]|nr:hypothetical protein [Desulfatiglandales bacterium]